MSRSVHATRSGLAALTKASFADRSNKDALVAEYVDDLNFKRDLKSNRAQARKGRRTTDRGEAPPLPVIVVDQAVTLGQLARGHLFPLSIPEIEAALAAFPNEVAGVSKVVIGRCSNEGADELGGGVYQPNILGWYDRSTRVIFLSAYFVDAAATLDAAALQVLRLQAFETLFHELGHHVDRRPGIRRASGANKAGHQRTEQRAEAFAARALRAFAMPYLLAHADQPGLEQFHRDVLRLDVPLTWLLSIVRGVHVYPFWKLAPLHDDWWRLWATAQQPRLRFRARLRFARDLSHAGHHDAAIDIFEAAVKEPTTPLAAWKSLADAYGRADRLVELEALRLRAPAPARHDLTIIAAQAHLRAGNARLAQTISMTLRSFAPTSTFALRDLCQTCAMANLFTGHKAQTAWWLARWHAATPARAPGLLWTRWATCQLAYLLTFGSRAAIKAFVQGVPAKAIRSGSPALRAILTLAGVSTPEATRPSAQQLAASGWLGFVTKRGYVPAA